MNDLQTLLGAIDWRAWLGLSVLGALISTVGSLVGMFLKERFFVRGFETWKRRQELLTAYQRYRDPLAVSAAEIARRLGHILEDFPPEFLDRHLLLETPHEGSTSNRTDDPYYMRSRFMSTLYRFCALLGWIERYRREVVFLDSGNDKQNAKLQLVIQQIQAALADAEMTAAPPYSQHHDDLILREEQRAIGEVMLDDSGAVLGYAAFVHELENRRDGLVFRWVNRVIVFFSTIQPTNDFRLERASCLVCHLVDLVELLSGKRANPEFAALRNEHTPVVKAVADALAAVRRDEGVTGYDEDLQRADDVPPANGIQPVVAETSRPPSNAEDLRKPFR